MYQLGADDNDHDYVLRDTDLTSLTLMRILYERSYHSMHAKPTFSQYLETMMLTTSAANVIPIVGDIPLRLLDVRDGNTLRELPRDWTMPYNMNWDTLSIEDRIKPPSPPSVTSGPGKQEIP